MDKEWVELLPSEYLKDLAQRIFRIPVMYGVDQYDYERLNEIARDLAQQQKKES